MRLPKVLGSLQAAVILLLLFAGVLFLGTLVESWYDSAVARQLVYQTWWFAALLALLGVNIFFAAVKKWPWKRHQTGFLITHVGLLCLVAGGIINSLAGTAGMMNLIDSDGFQASQLGSHQSNAVTVVDSDTLSVKRAGSSIDEGLVAPFQPGAAAWEAAAILPGPIEQPARTLVWLAHPWPRSWSHSFDEKTKLEVLEYLPHSRLVPFAAAGDDDPSFLAIGFDLASPAFGELGTQWVGMRRGLERRRVGSARVELLGTAYNQQQLEEFHQQQPFARLEDSSIKGLLQFVTDAEGNLHYRTFAGSSIEGLGFEQSGKIVLGESVPIWRSKNWRLTVNEILPRANFEPYYVPVERRLGQVDPAAGPAVRCRLSTASDSAEFWMRKTNGDFQVVKLDGDEYYVGYHPAREFLDFELTLLRAEQTIDVGSSQAASQTSYVLLNDPLAGVAAQPHIIRFNEPLQYGGYKIYQSDWRTVGNDGSRPINMASLKVRRDPGVRLKYAGSLMVGLGIACMFYMRAYFFKRKEPLTETPQPEATADPADDSDRNAEQVSDDDIAEYLETDEEVTHG